MKVLLAFGWLALAVPVCAQSVSVSQEFRGRLSRVPLMTVVVDTLAVAEGRFSFISAVSVDRENNLYVLHRPETGDPVVVLDPLGRFVRSWGEGRFATPHGIRVDPDGNVWTIDAEASVIEKFTSSGDLLWSVHLDMPEGPFCGATDVAFGADGAAFVADGYCSGRIVRLDSTGHQVGEWGARGSEDGHFLIPHGIATAPGGRIFVADRNNSRIQVFDQNGRWLDTWQYGGMVPAVAVGPTGEMYASLVFDADWTEGYVVRIDPADGHMLSRVAVVAHELAVGPNGSILPAVEDVVLRLIPTASPSRH